MRTIPTTSLSPATTLPVESTKNSSRSRRAPSTANQQQSQRLPDLVGTPLLYSGPTSFSPAPEPAPVKRGRSLGIKIPSPTTATASMVRPGQPSPTNPPEWQATPRPTRSMADDEGYDVGGDLADHLFATVFASHIGERTTAEDKSQKKKSAAPMNGSGEKTRPPARQRTNRRDGERAEEELIRRAAASTIHTPALETLQPTLCTSPTRSTAIPHPLRRRSDRQGEGEPAGSPANTGRNSVALGFASHYCSRRIG